MGWQSDYTWLNRKPSMKEVREHLRECFTWSTEKVDTTVEMDSIRFGEYYAVLKQVNEKKGVTNYFGLAVLWSSNNNEICHKDMDESCGPVIINAPKKHVHFLNEHSPITDEMVENDRAMGWARDWRNAVLNRKPIKKVKDGQRVKFAHPITFSGEDFTVFTVKKVGRKTFFRPDGKSWYGNIRKYGMKEFTVLKEDNDE